MDKRLCKGYRDTHYMDLDKNPDGGIAQGMGYVIEWQKGPTFDPVKKERLKQKPGGLCGGHILLVGLTITFPLWSFISARSLSVRRIADVVRPSFLRDALYTLRTRKQGGRKRVLRVRTRETNALIMAYLWVRRRTYVS